MLIDICMKFQNLIRFCDRLTDAWGKTICLPTLNGGDINIRIEILFFNLHHVMKTVVVTKGASWNFSSTHCLHHIMKVEKLNFNA